MVKVHIHKVYNTYDNRVDLLTYIKTGYFILISFSVFNTTFSNISAISWRPVCMSDEYASDNVNRKRF